eukprot:4769684-Pleurochrysis_carterae.AAC.1
MKSNDPTSLTGCVISSAFPTHPPHLKAARERRHRNLEGYLAPRRSTGTAFPRLIAMPLGC